MIALLSGILSADNVFVMMTSLYFCVSLMSDELADGGGWFRSFVSYFSQCL